MSKTKIAKTLPKTVEEIENGGIYIQFVKCGKPNCKCARGGRHSAFYFFSRQNGKKIKTYIRKAEFANFGKLVDQALKIRNERRETQKQSEAFLQKSRQMLREFRDLLK